MTMNGHDFELRHWRFRPKSLSIPPTPLDIPFLSPSPSLNGEAGYTSLRDLIGEPGIADVAAGSPSPAGGPVRIKNRLLNKAACAYLQPTPSSTERRRRQRRRFSLGRAFGECFGFIERFFFWRVRVGKRSS